MNPHALTNQPNPEPSPTGDAAAPANPVARRDFLKGCAASAIATAASAVSVNVTSPSALADSPATNGSGILTGAARRARAAQIRNRAIVDSIVKAPIIAKPVTNGDEALYANRVNQFSKGLIHLPNGEVDPAAYDAYIAALQTGEFSEIEKLTLGCPNPAAQRPLRSPLTGLAFDMEGADAFQCTVPAAPAFASAWAAGEAVELHWMAHLRDVHFSDYASSPLAALAASELTAMTDFRGLKSGGAVTASTLFRDPFPGCAAGPWVSQFLLKTVPYGTQWIDARQRTAVAGVNFVKTFPEWLDLMRGCQPTLPFQTDPQVRYIRNARDVAAWVQTDIAYQGFLIAALALMMKPNPSDPLTGGGFGAPLSPTNPYRTAVNQDAFITLGPVDIFGLIAEVVARAMKAAWYQKWYVHRRARPEAFCGRVRQVKQGLANYPLHADVLDSQAVAATFASTGDYFLPLAYPEGSPLHPSYPSGHATLSGACATMLKALFDDSFVLPSPKVASADGLSLDNYTGLDAGQLTVGGELNKLASNIATARNIAGIHWRTDGNEGIRLGEAVAISLLRELKETYAEDFDGFRFTKFDGTLTTI
jgi:membrane-associated phospholipid phosphatase